MTKKIYKKRGGNFKAKVAFEALKETKTLGELSSEYSVASSQISSWKKHLEENMSRLFEEEKNEKDLKGEIDRLHRVIGKITAERDFLERALNH